MVRVVAWVFLSTCPLSFPPQNAPPLTESLPNCIHQAKWTKPQKR